MPIVQAETLRRIGHQLFEAAGCDPEDARVVTHHLVESNLFGHDSHGVIRYPEYMDAIRTGRFQAKAQPRVVRDHPSCAVVDAAGALGQVGAAFATRLAMDKASRHGVAAVALRNTSHVGRVGAYPLMVGRAGMIGQAFVNGGRFGNQIAPFGGIDARLTTDPLAFAAPRRNAEPIFLDMTTSVAAEGKVRVASYAGKQVPEGWLIDHEGRPTTDPDSFRATPKGAILPLGGIASHKGYGMSLMVELLAGTLSGQGCCVGESEMVSNGMLLAVHRIDHFIDPEDYYQEVEALIRYVRSSPPAPGFKEILLPGEPELRSARRREADGIELDDKTWSLIGADLERFGLPVPPVG